ncbi:hypothetical protein HK096_004858, partial [Nowakowskiella sp. JEL0078]
MTRPSIQSFSLSIPRLSAPSATLQLFPPQTTLPSSNFIWLTYSIEIIPAILQNLSLALPTTIESANPRLSKTGSITDDLITDSEVVHLAHSCLLQLFSRTNASTLKLLLTSVYEFCETRWSEERLMTLVFKSIANAVPTQYQYVITTSIMDRLQESQISSDKKFSNSQQKSTHIRVLKYFIDHGIGIAGLTVLEILETLVKLLTDISKTSREDPAYKNDLDMVIRTIGKLASHLQYPEQLNDIFGFILNRLRVNFSSSPVPQLLSTPAIQIQLSNIVEVSGFSINVVSETEDLPESEKDSPASGTIITSDPSTNLLRTFLFQALEELVQTRIQSVQTMNAENNPSPTDSQSSDTVSVKAISLGGGLTRHTTLKFSTNFRNPVNYDVVVPMIPFLVDDETNVRLSVAKFLFALVSLEAVEAGIPNVVTPEIHKLRIHVHRAVHLYLQRNSLAPFDYAVLLAILTKMTERYTHHEIVDAIPLLYSKRLAPRFLQLYFRRAAIYCVIEGLGKRDSSDIGNNVWSRIAEDSLDNLKGLEFSEGEEMSGVWLTRQEIIGILEADQTVVSKVPLFSEKLNATFGEGDEYLG